MLVGATTELHIEEASHLYLGMNFSGTPSCQGELSATISITPKGSSVATPVTSRGQQLKSQLGTAAQVFMSGQFGISKPAADTFNATSSGSNAIGDASPATSLLNLSDAPLDSQLRKSIDSLPRRVNDQFQNLGDMVNFVIVGSKQDVQNALTA